MSTQAAKWPRYDPCRGYWLCESCWNYQHVVKFHDALTGKWKRRSMCSRRGCECPCTGEHDVKPQKFTGEGQQSISMENPLYIDVKS